MFILPLNCSKQDISAKTLGFIQALGAVAIDIPSSGHLTPTTKEEQKMHVPNIVPHHLIQQNTRRCTPNSESSTPKIHPSMHEVLFLLGISDHRSTDIHQFLFK